MIDDAPAKHGYYTPGSHFLIRSNDPAQRAAGLSADFRVGFFNEIAEKCSDYLATAGA